MASSAARLGELEFDDERSDGELNLPSLTDEVMRPIAELLQSEAVTLVGHDLKRSLLALRTAGIEMNGPMRDVMIAS